MPTFKKVDIDIIPLEELVSELQNILDEVANLEPFTVRLVDGRDEDNDKIARSERARVAREILRGAELAGLLRAELHLRYWQMKGHDDPRSHQ